MLKLFLNTQVYLLGVKKKRGLWNSFARYVYKGEIWTSYDR